MKKRWTIPAVAVVISLLLASCLANIPAGKDKAADSPVNDRVLSQATDSTPDRAHSDTLIGTEEAVRIALKHAAVAQEEAKFVKAELDRDRGQDHYEVEFYHNGYEYDYKIHAHSGQILLAEKERD